jgi:hypothetical protein
VSKCSAVLALTHSFFLFLSSLLGYPRKETKIIIDTNPSSHFFRSKACKTASKQLIGLRDLKIWIQIHDISPTFSLREPWLKPLFHFRRLTTRRNLPTTTNDGNDAAVILESVYICIQTRWTKNPVTAFAENRRLAQASMELHRLYAHAIGLAIKGAKEKEAMASFNNAWYGQHRRWRHHLQFARTGW